MNREEREHWRRTFEEHYRARGEQRTSRGRRAIYPWERWADGRVHVARMGKDFNCTVSSFQQSIANKAREMGTRYWTERSGSVVHFQFDPGAEQ